MFDNLGEQIYNTLIANDRWTMFLDGLLVTLMIAGIAVLMGVVIGSLVAIAKVNAMRNKHLKWLNVICDIYLTVIRGTPVLVQLLIMYYIIFAAAPIEMAPYVAALAFGINSGAYVAEIVRSGIMAVPRGQMEAGRSLGLTNGMTMRTIIFPQAIKNILPALGNEFIVLFKEDVYCWVCCGHGSDTRRRAGTFADHGRFRSADLYCTCLSWHCYADYMGAQEI